MARFDCAVLHGLLSMADPEEAIVQCRFGGKLVATQALVQGVDNVIMDIEDSDGLPLQHPSDLMWASAKRNMI